MKFPGENRKLRPLNGPLNGYYHERGEGGGEEIESSVLPTRKRDGLFHGQSQRNDALSIGKPLCQPRRIAGG